MKKYFKQMKNQKGMTLVELLAVLVILGIIAAIAVPMIGGIISDSEDKAVLADAQTILNGAKLAHTSDDPNGTDPNWAITDLSDYVEGLPNDASYKVFYNDGNWVVNYNKFGTIEIEDFKADTEDMFVSEENLIQMLKGETPTGTDISAAPEVPVVQ